MAQIIAVAIGVLVLIIGFVIYKIGLEILDEGDYFFYAVAFFLILFFVAGIALYFILPRPPKNADLGTLSPNRVLNAVTEFAQRPYANQTNTISYSAE